MICGNDMPFIFEMILYVCTFYKDNKKCALVFGGKGDQLKSMSLIFKEEVVSTFLVFGIHYKHISTQRLKWKLKKNVITRTTTTKEHQCLRLVFYYALS